MIEFCKCDKPTGVHIDFEDSWGYWETCDNCKKRLEDGHHFYNHYDGEDHDYVE